MNYISVKLKNLTPKPCLTLSQGPGLPIWQGALGAEQAGIRIPCGRGYSWPARADFTGVNKQTDRRLPGPYVEHVVQDPRRMLSYRGPLVPHRCNSRVQGLEKPQFSKLGNSVSQVRSSVYRGTRAGRTQGAHHSGHG